MIGLLYLVFALLMLLYLAGRLHFASIDKATRDREIRISSGSIITFALIGTVMLVADRTGFVLWMSHQSLGNWPFVLAIAVTLVCCLPMLLSAFGGRRS